MKLAKSSTQTSQSSSSDTHQYKISANGTAFQILSSGLYSNKHAAVLRELGCNAADAHVAAGITKTPIQVTLPTEKNRELAIRDFGLGMSHEQILSLYTTYFSSDKRDSNAFVGGLGLGSKSPFAYTNSFTVTSIHQSIKRVYSCNIASDGAPTITRLQEAPSQEPHGVEIRLLTKQQDLHLFMREASNVFQWFETTPTFNVPVEFHESQRIALSTPAYDICKDYRSKHFIKMGNVTYPLQQSALDLPVSTLWPELLSNISLVLKAPIGHLQIAASREALQYDPTTKKNLLQLYQQAYNDIARRIVAEMTDPSRTTAWTQESAVLEWYRQNLSSVDKKLVAKMIAQSGSNLDVQRAAAAMVKPSPSVPTLAGSSSAAGVYWYNAGATGRKTVEKGYVSVGKNSVRPQMVQAFETAVVIADDKQITEKIAFWREMRKFPSLLLVSPSTKNDLAFAQGHANDIATKLGGVPVLLLSQMPLPNMTPVTAVKRDYVEIDDRMVNVWDMAKDNITTMRFADVPLAMRYALVRNTAVSKSQGVVYLESDAKSQSTLIQHQLQDWTSFFSYMASKNTPWSGPTGAIVLRPVDVDRLKIENAGIPWFLPSLRNALLNKTNQTFVETAQLLWPQDHNLSSWQQKKTQRASGWLGDFGAALHQMTNKNSQIVLRQLLQDAGLLEHAIARASSKNVTQHNAWTGYHNIIKTLQNVYQTTQKTLVIPLDNAAQSAKTIAAFPLLEHISSDMLFELAGKKKSDAHQQQVFNVLRICLGLPIGP